MTAATKRRPVVSVLDPIRDDNYYLLWLVPGDWTRGRAVAHVARETGAEFVRLRAGRVWLRWAPGLTRSGGHWQLSDGYMELCDHSEPDAEPYWEVTEILPPVSGQGKDTR